MATAAPLHADRGNGRTYTAADRRRSGETSTHGGLSDGHLKLHPDLHHLDGRDRHLPYKLRCYLRNEISIVAHIWQTMVFGVVPSRLFRFAVFLSHGPLN